MKEYTATTTNATNNVTAYPTDSSADISIDLNGADFTNGTSATWSEGMNTLTIIVTNGAMSDTYTIIITKP